MTRLRYVEVCAGAGGLGLGLHRAGWTGTSMELDADAAATHNANVGPCLQADITSASAPHAADLVAGGVPCQSFSIAGEQGGMDDPRGRLFASLLRIGVEAGARCVLLENVRGMVSSGAVPVILAAFRAHGFHATSAVLCAEDYGVPQARRRLFIVGFADPMDLARFRWPAPSHGAPGNLYGLPQWRTVRDALALPEGEYRRGPLPQAKKYGSQGMIYANVDAPSRTISGQSNGDWIARVGESGKRVGIAQIATLQSFPESFAFSGGCDAQNQQIGNAVPPLLGEAVGGSIRRALYEDES